MNILKGRRVVITGPTSGIGKQIAIQLGGFGAALRLCHGILANDEIWHRE